MSTYWTNFGKSQGPGEPFYVICPWTKVTKVNETYMCFQNPLEMQKRMI